MAKTQKGMSDEIRDKLDLAEKSFKTVLDADIHMDNKASRVLTAMAFLTAAAVAVFVKASSTPLRENPYCFLPFVFDYTLTVFWGYMVFVLIGSMFYLSAIGPSLNIIKTKRKETQKQFSSLLFFEFISNTDEWKSSWEKDPETIANEMICNLIDETKLIAEKASAKYKWMNLGNIFIRASLFFFILLISSLFPLVESFVFTHISICLFYLALAFEEIYRPANKPFAILQRMMDFKISIAESPAMFFIGFCFTWFATSFVLLIDYVVNTDNYILLFIVNYSILFCILMIIKYYHSHNINSIRIKRMQQLNKSSEVAL